MTHAAAFLIVGDDPHLVSEELGKLLEDVVRLAVDVFDAEDDPGVIIESLATTSMFSERRTVVLKGVDTMNAEAQRRLLEYLDDPAPDSTLIMTAFRPVSKLATAVRKVGRVVEAAKGRRSDLFNWLGAEAKKRGLKLTGEAMSALMDSVGEARGALAGALEELALAHAAGARLGPKEIAGQFQHRPEAKLFGFIDAVAERRTGAALESLSGLLGHGDAPGSLLWQLHRHFRMLLTAQGQHAAGVAQKLGIQPWRAEKLVRQSNGFRTEQLIDAYIVLAEADRKTKSSVEPEGLTLERTVVAICEPVAATAQVSR